MIVGCCLIPIGSIVMLIKDYLTYHTLGDNLKDLFCITAIASLNAILFSVIAGVIKERE